MNRRVSERLYRSLDPWRMHTLGHARPLSPAWLREKLVKIYFWSNRQRAIRYRPVLSILKRTVQSETPFLEVGSGCLGISPYTSHYIVGLDKNTDGPRLPNMILVTGDAIRLPFQDNSFELVCSIDMLEHLPVEQRGDAVLEICRVARKIAVIAAPCGRKSETWERKARERYSSIMSKKNLPDWERRFVKQHNQYLFEHAEHGLPSADEILGYLRSYQEHVQGLCNIYVIGNESRYIWYLGALGYMRFGYLRSAVTTLLFAVLFPFISRLKLGGHYRKVFIIDKSGGRFSRR